MSGEKQAPSGRAVALTTLGMTHPLNINNGRLTALFLGEDRMEDLTQHSTRSRAQTKN